MDLLAIAVPFLLALMLIELAADRLLSRGLYRVNDAVNSLSTGVINVTTGYFTKVVGFVIWGFVLQHLAIFSIPLDAFAISPSGLAWWALAIIAWDFCYYWSHRFGHEISVFWAGHAVHHQSEDYNLSTALRQPSTGFLLNWVFYLPLFLVGFPLEILVTVNAINLIYQFWVHTQFITRLGILEWFLVTPSNHRVHHAQNERYIDRNYGGMFIVWDRLFGSFQDELDDEIPVYGVRRPLHSWDPFWANLKVYADLAFDSLHTRAWRDKLRVWFARTGWRPEDVKSRYPAAHSDLRRFEKYDPPLSSGLKAYVALQCAAVIAGTLWVGLVYVDGGLSAIVWPCMAIWASLYVIGWMNQGRRLSGFLEALRLLGIGAFAASTAAQPMVLGGYVVISLFGLFLVILLDKKQTDMKAISKINEVSA
ncbi:MAG: sterol desaturase family protein [Pseudomonadota bacterium]